MATSTPANRPNTWQQIESTLRAREADPAYASAPILDAYARISRSPDGELEKTDRQLLDVLAVIAARGARLGVVLRDDNLSAWKINGKRPGWRALVDRLKAGASVGVVGWHTDRLMRQPRDLEELIAFGDRGLLLGSCHGEYDLADADHRFQLRILVAAACKASDDTSRRQKRKHEAMRAEGKLNGGTRALGYQAAGTCEHAEGKRCQHVTEEHLVMERDAIAWAAQALLTGTSLFTVAAQWNVRGMHTFGRTGQRQPVTVATVRSVMLRARTAGMVEHNGTVVRAAALPEGVEPIIELATYEQLQSLFAARRRGRPVSPVFMLSGVLRCAQCGRGMGGETRTDRLDPEGNPRRLYRCPRIGGCGSSTSTRTRPRRGPSRRPSACWPTRRTRPWSPRPHCPGQGRAGAGRRRGDRARVVAPAG